MHAAKKVLHARRQKGVAYKAPKRCCMHGAKKVLHARRRKGVACTLYPLPPTLYSVLCTLYSVLCILYSVLSTLYPVICTLYSVIYTLYSVLCAEMENPFICWLTVHELIVIQFLENAHLKVKHLKSLNCDNSHLVTFQCEHNLAYKIAYD